MAVRVIKARTTDMGSVVGQSIDEKKLRVAAYCRVSTDLEEQESSYEAQCNHYESFIRSNPKWEPAGIFADEGITGTSTKKRDEFNRMIRLCEAHQIDMVITKSISRFARNTLDCLEAIRKLKALGIAVLFEKESINTLDAKGEVLITIMASIAQQESQSISQNVRMGIQYRFQQGVPLINTSRFLGYKKNEKGDLVIDEEEAVTVRRIFRAYIEGFSPESIAKQLRVDHVPSGSGRSTWPVSTVRYILQNEKYMGDLLLQKTLVTDYLTHKSIWNKGELPQYYVENSHEPIIPREVFRIAQGETLRRKRLSDQGIVVRYGRKFALSGRMFCEKCGAAFRRFQCAKTNWRCLNSLAGTCNCKAVMEVAVQRAIINAFFMLRREKENIIRLQERERVKIEMIDARLEEVEDKIRKEEDAHPGKKTPLDGGKLLKSLNTERENLLIDRSEHAVFDVHCMITLELIDALEGRPNARRFFGDASKPACYDIDDFFDRTRPKMPGGAIKVFDEDKVVRYIKDVIICPDKIQVNFKAGVTIEEKR